MMRRKKGQTTNRKISCRSVAGAKAFVDFEELPATPQFAEKVWMDVKMPETIPQRLKPGIHFSDFSGTDKSVPFQNCGSIAFFSKL